MTPSLQYLTSIPSRLLPLLSLGAKLANGRQGGGQLAGQLMTPAVVDFVTPEMRLFHEEQFGPVVPVSRYAHVSQVRRCNSDLNSTIVRSEAVRWGVVEVSSLLFIRSSSAPSFPCPATAHVLLARHVGLGWVKLWLGFGQVGTRPHRHGCTWGSHPVSYFYLLHGFAS